MYVTAGKRPVLNLVLRIEIVHSGVSLDKSTAVNHIVRRQLPHAMNRRSAPALSGRHHVSYRRKAPIQLARLSLVSPAGTIRCSRQAQSDAGLIIDIAPKTSRLNTQMRTGTSKVPVMGQAGPVPCRGSRQGGRQPPLTFDWATCPASLRIASPPSWSPVRAPGYRRGCEQPRFRHHGTEPWMCRGPGNGRVAFAEDWLGAVAACTGPGHHDAGDHGASRQS